MTRPLNGRRGKLYVPRSPFRGAHVMRSTNVAVSGQSIPWNLEVFDVGEWFGVNTTDMIPPKDVSFVRASTAFSGSANVLHAQRARFDGIDVVGSPTRLNSSQGATIDNCTSAILPVVGGKTVITAFEGGAPTVSADPRCYFAVEAVDPRLRKALIYLDQNESILTTRYPYLHVSKVYDIGGWWKGGLEFVVPRGVRRARITAQLTMNAAGPEWMGVVKNGRTFQGSGLQGFYARGNSPSYANVVSAIIDVVPGDRLGIITSTGNVMVGLTGTIFNFVQVEELPLDHDYALVRKTTAQSITSGTVTFSADGLLRDIAGIYRPGTTPNALTVPSGCGYKYGRFSWSMNINGGTPANYFLVYTALAGGPANGPNAAQISVDITQRWACGMTPWAPVNDGQTFSVATDTPGVAATISADDFTWMQLELRRE